MKMYREKSGLLWIILFVKCLAVLNATGFFYLHQKSKGVTLPNNFIKKRIL